MSKRKPAPTDSSRGNGQIFLNTGKLFYCDADQELERAAQSSFEILKTQVDTAPGDLLQLSLLQQGT